MNTHSTDEEAELNRLTTLFVEVYTRHAGVTMLDENQADNITDDFHVMVMDQFVNPFATGTDQD